MVNRFLTEKENRKDSLTEKRMKEFRENGQKNTMILMRKNSISSKDTDG